MTKFKILIATVLIIILGWTGAWFFGASILRKNINAQMTASAESFSCAQDAIGGYPFRLFYDCRELTLVQGDWTLKMARAKASVVVTQPKLLVGALQSPLEISDAFSGAHYFVHWGEAKLSLRHDLQQLNDARLEFAKIRVNETGDTGTDTLSADALKIYLQTRAPNEQSADTNTRDTENYALFAGAEGLAMPSAEISKGRVELDLLATQLPPIDGRPVPAGYAHMWQQAGGKIILNKFIAHIAEAQLTATGEFSLDAQGLATGTSELDLINFDKYIAALPLGPMVNDILGPPPAPGQPQHLSVLMRNGIVFLGPLPLLQLPPLF